MSPIHRGLPTGRHRAPARTRRHPLRRRTLTGSAALAVAFAAAIPLATPAAAGSTTVLGAVGDVAGLSQHTGQQLATHAYGQFSGSVPTGRMISVRQSNATWKQVAGAQPGSATYSNIVRWATTLKGRSGTVNVAYHHEPEASSSSKYGTAADFIAAYRRVVTIFRQQGANNVRFTWQMTEWSFRTSPSDPRYAAKWYPGDAYVDDVGGDAYNWYNCGSGSGKWVELSTMLDPVVAFAKAHGKTASLPEFGSEPGAQRTTWLQNARSYLVAHSGQVSGAYYFQHAPTNPNSQTCSWPLNTQSEYGAYGAMAQDRTHFSTS